MLPYLNIFGIKFPMYGLLIVLGCALAIFIVIKFRYKKSISGSDIGYCCCYTGIMAIIGAKLLYIITVLPNLIDRISSGSFTTSDFLNLLSGGFVFYGGAIGGILGVFIYSKQFKVNFLDLIENMIPGVPLAHAIGRIGCFCAGCCYGMPYPPPIGVYFKPDSVAPLGQSFFPIQLCEAFLNLILFIIIFTYSRHERKPGKIIGMYLIGYGIERFILEFFRYDSIRGIFFGLSTSQWISIILIPIGILFFVGIFNKKRSIPKEAQ